MQEQRAPGGPALTRGDEGAAVLELRHRLVQLEFLAPDPLTDDVFDDVCDRAVRAFQQCRGLRVDGRVDAETRRVLDEARWHLGDRTLCYAVRHPYTGDDVAELQRRLIGMGFDCGRADGAFGPRTENALREFQHNVGLPVDGTCGPATFRALRQLARTVVGGNPNELREYEHMHHAGPTLAGKLIVVDPGHGGADRGASRYGFDEAGFDEAGFDEAGIVDDVANRVEGRLSAAGAQAFRTRGSESVLGPHDQPPSDADRAAFANAAEADLLVSLHVDGVADTNCHGLSTYYFGSVIDRSLVGAQLAELVQQEILARTDLLDARTHPKTWELLRSTRMPAVRIELGYLSNPGDAGRLARSEFRDALAEAIVVAVQRLYLPAELAGVEQAIDLARLTGAALMA